MSSVASVLEGAKSLFGSFVEGARPQISRVIRATEPLVFLLVKKTQSCVSFLSPMAQPVIGLFDKLRLNSSNPHLRRKSVEKLSDSNRPSDTELIFAHLHDHSPQVRCAAVGALARKKTQDSLNSIIGALQDDSFEVREAAARALGSLRDGRSTNALASCLRDRDTAVRIAVAQALRSLGWRPSTRDELAWFEITLGNLSAPAVSAVQPQAEPATTLNEAARLNTAFFRRLAEQELKERIDPARITQLRTALRGNDLLARVSAVHDLGQIRHPEITRELLALFRHPDPETRLVAAQVLAACEDSSPAHFLGLLQDPSPEVRLAAVQFLGKIRHKYIAQVLSPLLSDENSHVRQAAAAAVG